MSKEKTTSYKPKVNGAKTLDKAETGADDTKMSDKPEVYANSTKTSDKIEMNTKKSKTSDNYAVNTGSTKTLTRDSIISYRRTMFSSKMIGTPDDLIPFAWREPLKLQKNKKMTKVLKEITSAQEMREMPVPVKTDK